jgi:pimeloyl-ACP methyl ester carboxylesterase
MVFRMPAPIVFVHGLIHACRSLHGLEGGGAPGAFVLAPDLPGYGYNDPGSATSIPRALDFLLSWMNARHAGAVHLAGHSVGGAVAMLFAHRHPERVRSIVNLEGNFTLRDAFWSKGIAEGTEAEADAMLAAYRADPAAWLAGQGIARTSETLARARVALREQSGRSMRSLACSVVDLTAAPAYLDRVADVIRRGTPVHLVAGVRTVSDWDVPDFVRAAAASSIVMPGVGHMMMLEDPSGTAAAVRAAIDSVPDVP